MCSALPTLAQMVTGPLATNGIIRMCRISGAPQIPLILGGILDGGSRCYGAAVDCRQWLGRRLAVVRATLPSALNVMNASSVGKLVQLVTASRLILYHEGRIDPMKDECHYQIQH